MNVYIKYFIFNFAERKKYVINALGELLILPVNFGLYAFLYFYIYNANAIDEIKGFNLTTILTYTLLASIIKSSLPSAEISSALTRQVLRGDITQDLTKPVSHYWWTFCKNIPKTVISLVVGSLFFIIIAFIFPNNFVFPSFVQLLIVIPYLVLAIFLSYTIYYATGILAFHFGLQWWMRQLITTTIVIFGGGLIPIAWFPDALGQIINYLPFRYIIGGPIEILLGHWSEYVILDILVGYVWLFLLLCVTRSIWKKGLTKYTSPGG